MTETNTDKFLDGFRQWWLKQGYAKRSADSYCSGIRRVNKEFFLPIVHKDLFIELEKAITKGCAVDYIYALTGIIGAKILNARDLKEQKHYQDMRSCLSKFTEYITESQESILMPQHWGGANEVELTNLNSESDHEYYDYATLIKILWRQIRGLGCINAKEDVFFCLWLLESLFLRKDLERDEYFERKGLLSYNGKSINFRKWYPRWIQSILNRVKIHTLMGDFTLSQVEGLLIEHSTSRVWIVDREQHRTIPVMTESESGLIPIEARSLGDIKLKRSESTISVMTRLWDAMPVMRKIAEEIRKTVKGQTITKEDGTVIAIDSFKTDTLTAMSYWYLKHVDWNVMAPLLSLVRVELGYFAAATHLTLISTTNTLQKH